MSGATIRKSTTIIKKRYYTEGTKLVRCNTTNTSGNQMATALSAPGPNHNRPNITASGLDLVSEGAHTATQGTKCLPKFTHWETKNTKVSPQDTKKVSQGGGGQ